MQKNARLIKTKSPKKPGLKSESTGHLFKESPLSQAPRRFFLCASAEIGRRAGLRGMLRFVEKNNEVKHLD